MVDEADSDQQRGAQPEQGRRAHDMAGRGRGPAVGACLERNSSRLSLVPITVTERDTEQLPRIHLPALIIVCSTKLLLHVFTSLTHYGYFRDELYFIICGRHPQFGYVDQPPVVPLLMKTAAASSAGSQARVANFKALIGTAGISRHSATVVVVRPLPAQNFWYAALCAY